MVVVVLVEEEKAIAPLSHCLFLWSDALQVLPRRVSRLSRDALQDFAMFGFVVLKFYILLVPDVPGIDKTLETHNISLHVWIVIRI